MRRLTSHMRVLCFICLIAIPVTFTLSPHQAVAAADKVKVLYHVDGKDPEVAKYALALINKHIDAEGGPDKIEVELVVHGPALELFEKDKMDPEMKGRDVPGIDEGIRQDHRKSCKGVRRHTPSRSREAYR
jgi:uncharacterized protein